MELVVQMDAQVARDRCLQAMESTDDLETKRSLWKAALKYHGRVRDEVGAEGLKTSGRPLAHRAEWGSLRAVRELR